MKLTLSDKMSPLCCRNGLSTKASGYANISCYFINDFGCNQRFIVFDKYENDSAKIVSEMTICKKK